MAQNQYISLKVSGRPDASGGYNPLILFNNPAFEIEDQDYVGFDNNSYFYSIKDFEKFTVYKLVKNNVRSYNGIRLSTIKIAFSVPNGYSLDNNVTPYDVLNKLKDTFLSRCLKCVDTVKETYEYISNRIEADVLDDVVKGYTISQKPSSLRKMNPNSPIGYIVKPDAKIEEFFHDFNYHEFVKYSEVIIAEQVNQTNYVPINIQIPRPTSYDLYVDGVLKGTYSDLNQTISVSSQKPSLYYENKSVDFTIQNLIDGDIIYLPGIEIDKVNEKITVSTQGWATPKHRKIELHIVPKDYENEIFTHSNLIRIMWPYGAIKLENDFSFTLKGEQIAEINNIKLELERNDRYQLVNYDIYDNELRATVSLISTSLVQKTSGAGQHRYQQQERVTDLQVVKSSPVYDVLIKLRKEIFEDGHENEIDVKLKTHPGNSNITLATCRTKFKAIPKSNEVYEGHFYVPKEFYKLYISNLYLCFQTNGKDYITKQALSFSNDMAVVEEKDFIVSKVEPFYKKKIFLIKLMIPLLAILFGYFLGYVAHGVIDKNSGEINKGADPYGPVIDEISRSMTEEQAINFLKDADNALKSKDLSFSKVDELYNKYLESKEEIDDVDEKQFNDKVCDRIEDYNKVMTFVTNGDVDKLREALSAYDRNDFHIQKDHAILLKKIIQDDTTIEKFRNNYSNISGFAQIGEAILDVDISIQSDTKEETNVHDPSHNAPVFYNCDKCGRSFTSSQQLANHKSKEHATQKRFTCKICGADVWFDTKQGLENHNKSKHER